MEVAVKFFLGGLYADVPVDHMESGGRTFRDYFQDRAWLTSNDGGEPVKFVCIEWCKRDLSIARAHGIGQRDSVLIRHEPICVHPMSYRKSIGRNFSRIIEPGKDPALNPFAVPRYQQLPLTINDDWKQRIFNQVVMINSNQISFVKGEFYSLRRRCVYEIDEVCLFGRNWNIGTMKRVRIATIHLLLCLRALKLPQISSLVYWFRRPVKAIASPDSKAEALQLFGIALVIENSAEFLTEKIFDALTNLCIPVYVGPIPSNFGIPEDLFIYAEPNIEAIKKAISIARLINYVEWKERTIRWVTSQETRRQWSPDAIIGQIYELIY